MKFIFEWKKYFHEWVQRMTSAISSLVRIWKISHSYPGCSYIWKIRVVYFSVKHSYLCNNIFCCYVSFLLDCFLNNSVFKIPQFSETSEKLVKINHVISMYYTCRHCHNRDIILFTPFCLAHGLKMAESSIDSSHWIYESKRIFGWLLLQRKLLFIREYTQVILQDFWHIV